MNCNGCAVLCSSVNTQRSDVYSHFSNDHATVCTAIPSEFSPLSGGYGLQGQRSAFMSHFCTANVKIDSPDHSGQRAAAWRRAACSAEMGAARQGRLAIDSAVCRPEGGWLRAGPVDQGRSTRCARRDCLNRSGSSSRSSVGGAKYQRWSSCQAHQSWCESMRSVLW